MAYEEEDDFGDVQTGPRAPSLQMPTKGALLNYTIDGIVEGKFKTVVRDATTKETKLDKNNNTMPQLNITLRTDLRNWDQIGTDDLTGAKKIPVDAETGQQVEDEGLRRIYAKYRMRQAIAEACAKVGFKSLPVGSRLQLKCVELVPTGKPNPLSVWKAKVTPPAPVEDDGFGNDAQPATAPTNPFEDAPAAQSEEPPF